MLTAGATLTLFASSFVIAQDLSPVAPFLDDKSIVVVDVDLTKVDLNAFEAQTVRSLEAAKMGPERVKQTREEMNASLARAQKWLDAMKAAKAERMYVVVAMPQGGGRGGPPMFTVIPAADDAAAAAVGRSIDEAMVPPKGQRQPTATHERIGGAVVIGEPATLAIARAIKPVDRPDLATARAQATKAGNGAVHVAFAPTGPLRGMVMMASDPVSAAAFNNGVQTAGLSVGLPPAESINVLIQSKDATAATAFVKWVGGFLGSRHAPQWTDLLQPTAAGDTVTLSLDQAETAKLIDGVLPSLLRARQTALAVQSASNIRQLLMMVMIYTNENENALPDSLADVRPDSMTPEQFARLTTNPQRPDAKPGYVYLKPVEEKVTEVKDAPQRMLIHEAFNGPFPATGVNVGFADGHVEMVRDEARFNALLKAAK